MHRCVPRLDMPARPEAKRYSRLSDAVHSQRTPARRLAGFGRVPPAAFSGPQKQKPGCRSRNQPGLVSRFEALLRGWPPRFLLIRFLRVNKVHAGEPGAHEPLARHARGVRGLVTRYRKHVAPFQEGAIFPERPIVVNMGDAENFK